MERRSRPEQTVFFTLSSWQLALVLAGIMFGATAIGLVAGRSLSRHADALREPFGLVQGALFTLVGLLLAFGPAMAVSRYDSRRTAVVDDANAIGSAYLRAQTLREPVKSAIAAGAVLQRRLWKLTGEALAASPSSPRPPRLYVESLNEMIDLQTTRVSALNNRVRPRSSLSKSSEPRPRSD